MVENKLIVYGRSLPKKLGPLIFDDSVVPFMNSVTIEH